MPVDVAPSAESSKPTDGDSPRTADFASLRRLVSEGRAGIVRALAAREFDGQATPAPERTTAVQQP